MPIMKSNHNKPPKDDRSDDQLEREIDILEKMWDRKLEKGDDDLYESATRHRVNPEKKTDIPDDKPLRNRRKGRGI
jgi:hypothetical protein